MNEKLKYIDLTWCLCLLERENNIKSEGFLCKIPYPNLSYSLPTIFVNIHFFDGIEINDAKFTIKIIYNNNEIINIKINKSRKIFVIKELKTIIIEIKPNKDHIKLGNFLDLKNEVKLKKKVYNYNISKLGKFFLISSFIKFNLI